MDQKTTRKSLRITPNLRERDGPGSAPETEPPCFDSHREVFKGGTSMFTRTKVMKGTLVILLLAVATVTRGAVQYDPILEWNGPTFTVVNNPDTPQLVNNPAIDFPFVGPTAIAAREHATGQRDVVYVVDSGNNRIQAFEANGYYVSTDETAFTWTEPVTAASQWDNDQVYLAEWAATATNWIVPGSITLSVDGTAWTYQSDLTGLTAADQVFSVDYDDATNAPEITLPANSLSATSEFTIRYAASDNQTGATDAFGVGDIDYGTGNGAAPVLTEITEATGGPTSFEQLRGLAVIQNEQTATSDDLFVVDAADATDQLFYYTVAVAGTATAGETYEDALSTPWDVAVARSGASVRATVTPADDTGPFDQATAVVVDDSQVTGHTYTVTVAGTDVSITDATTGRVLLDTAAFASLSDPFLGIPGLSLPLNAAVGASNTIATTQATIGRYVFVADTGNDRIKVLSAPDVASMTGGWLASDTRTVDAQPGAAIGGSGTTDYSETTPATITEDLTYWTTAFPIAEGTLASITFDPDGTPDVWTVVDDISTAGPSDNVYEVDWTNGMIRFGDGIHGALPPASTDFEYTYDTTPDVLRYGTSGTGEGRFSGPKGVAARYNSTVAAYDVYVSDTGNSRIQKLRFHPADAALGIAARMEFITEWGVASSATDVLSGPTDIFVAADGNTPVDVWVGVVDNGGDRVVIYDDTEASDVNGTTAPTFDSSLGSNGSSFGQYSDLSGLTALANGNDLDWYTVDAHRNIVTKYEESPTPTITMDFSALPECFPPTGSYTFSWTSTNVPEGGYIDFYYDTASTFDSDTAMLCFTAESISSTATSAVWTFASSPDGTPADGTYYLYARMHNSAGNLVANDATLSTELLCIDSTLLPTMAVADRIDGDNVLYLQNSLERVVDLNVLYPDSVISVGFEGTFDASVLEIVDITRGTAWDGIGATNITFEQTFDNVNGTFLIVSSALDAPSGLTANGPHTVASVTVRAKANAIDETNRFNSSVLAVNNSGSGLSDINGEESGDLVYTDMTVKIAYLADIASNAGAGGTVPAMTPDPDGFINFDDQMIFALGWNGASNMRDPIADIGPISGTAPDVVSDPDNAWNVEDIVTFTTMFSWAAANGYTGSGGAAPAVEDGGENLSVPFIVNSRPSLGPEVAGAAYAYVESHVDEAKPGATFEVDILAENLEDLNGALLNFGFDVDQIELIDARPGNLFSSAQGFLFLDRSGEGWVELSANRLDSAQPGVDGSGALAHLTFRMKTAATEEIDLAYDLRSSLNEILSRGSAKTGPLDNMSTSFQLYAPYPNPVSAQSQIVYALPTDGEVNLSVYDTAGRLVRTLAQGVREAGFHVVSFDGRNDNAASLPAGVYYTKLSVAGQDLTRKLVIAR